MPSSVNSSQPVDADGSLRCLSAWSVISLVLFVPALFAPLLLLVSLPHHSASGPAEGAEVAFLLFVCLGAGFGSTVLGVLTGWVGVRRSRGYPEWPWAGLALHGALLLLQLVLWIVLLPGSEAGAKWIVVLMIIIVGTVFAALVGAREFVARAKRTNDAISSSWRLWWMWVLGLACGTGVMGCILRLTMAMPG
jgi:hypothetical protein